MRRWPLIRKGGRRFRTSDGISSNLRMIFSDLYLHNFSPLPSSCCYCSLALEHGQWRKKKTTTEPASLAACLPAPWLASVFFGCIVTAGRTRHLIDRHPSVTNECYNRLASYVSYQWRHAVRFIHTNSRRSRMTDPEDASNLGCAYEESIRTSSRLEDSFSPRMKFLDGRKIGQTIRGRKQN